MVHPNNSQVTKLSLVINLKTAKALGLDVPIGIRRCRRTDRVGSKFAALHMSAFGTKQTFRSRCCLSAFGGKAEKFGSCHPTSCVLGLEVGHASCNHSVRAGDRALCGDIRRHFSTKSLHSSTGARASATPDNTHRGSGSRVGCHGYG